MGHADIRHPVGSHAGEHGHEKQDGEEPNGKKGRGELLGLATVRQASGASRKLSFAAGRRGTRMGFGRYRTSAAPLRNSTTEAQKAGHFTALLPLSDSLRAAVSSQICMTSTSTSTQMIASEESDQVERGEHERVYASGGLG